MKLILSSLYDRPVMVHRYPAAMKAFYMQPDAERPELALGFDMLAPEGYGEIIGGGERVADYDLLLKRLREHNLPEDAFGWYLDLRRYGSVPHAGFGLGLERTVAWICGTGAHSRSHSLSPHDLQGLSLVGAAIPPTWGEPDWRPIWRKKFASSVCRWTSGKVRRGVDMGPSAVRVAGLQTRLKASATRWKISAIVAVTSPKTEGE